MHLLDPHFLEFLRLLNMQQVQYLLVGGHAVNLHGYPRTTGDMDIWVKPDQPNAEKLVKALDAFGFDSALLLAQDFTKHVVFDVGEAPGHIEVMNYISGVRFAEAYPQRQLFEIQQVQVPVISLEHLKQNKKASGRHRDLDDLEHL